MCVQSSTYVMEVSGNNFRKRISFSILQSFGIKVLLWTFLIYNYEICLFMYFT